MIATQTSSPNFLLRSPFLTLLQIICGSLFIGLLAQIRLPLFFSPVPITGQTLAIMLVGATLGSRNGALAVMLYITEGCLGLPVFTGGHSGILSLIGPTGGYFLGFIAQAYFLGWVLERQNRFNSGKTIAALLFSCAIQMGLGMMWLSHFVGWSNVFLMGLLPFIPGEIAKSLGVATYLKARNEKNSHL